MDLYDLVARGYAILVSEARPLSFSKSEEQRRDRPGVRIEMEPTVLYSLSNARLSHERERVT
jgi:hypothetical protein